MNWKFLLVFFLSTFAYGQDVAVASNDAGDKVYRTPEVDSKPEVKDGMYTLPLFISQNFQLPDVHNKKIKLFVGFVVEKDGSITNHRFIHLSATPLDETKAALTGEAKTKEDALLDGMKTEALRVIKSFDKVWIPATKAGKPVRCQFNYPINFNLE